MKKQKFVERESFKHKFAKELLTKWLLETDIDGDYKGIDPIFWRRNYGVFSELKFYETSDLYYFETSEGLKEFDMEYFDKTGKDSRGQNPLGWFDPNFNRGKIIFVPDITIFHKGTPAFIVEIVHTHGLNQNKLQVMRTFFGGGSCTIYVIRAEDILRLTEKPLKLPIHQTIEL